MRMGVATIKPTGPHNHWKKPSHTDANSFVGTVVDFVLQNKFRDKDKCPFELCINNLHEMRV